jgi:hypothetical protein
LAGIFGQRYDGTGARLGTEFQVNTYTTGPQDSPVVAAGSGASFVVVWKSLLQDADHGGLFGQRYDGTGSTVGAEFRVNTHPAGSLNYATVAEAAAGRFVVVWASGDEYRRRVVLGKCSGCPAGDLGAALPHPTGVTGKEKRVARRLAGFARRTQKRIEKGVVAEGEEQQRQYGRACGQLERLLRAATKAHGKDRLGVPFEPLEAGVEGLRSALGC